MMRYEYETGLTSSFLGLPEEQTAFEESRVLILPIPYDGSTSYRPGARLGPQAILDASAFVETYDDELDLVPVILGFHTLPAIPATAAGADRMTERIYQAAREVLSRAGDRFLLSLGGEHSVTSGLVRAFAEKFDNLSVLHLDAHADLRDTYEDTGNSHACACRRLREHVERTVSVGIRSLSREEADRVEAEDIPLFFARDIVGRSDWVDEAVELLTGNVYVTIDLDVFDPSIMPATGTPEPGGLMWYEVLRLLRVVASRREVVGADIVELAPLPGNVAPDFLAAKLALKVATYAREGEIRAYSAG
jgi:N1-aminopropylagmatine ureohydrolase